MTRPEATYQPIKLNLPKEDVAEIIRREYQDIINGRGYSLTNKREVDRIIRTAARWLTDYNLRPSLLISGRIGNGKTTLLRAIHRTLQRCGEVSSRAFVATDLVYYIQEKPHIYQQMLDDTFKYLLLDDVGEESLEFKMYGNSELPVVRMINGRYLTMMPMIITTNLSDVAERPNGVKVNEFEIKYGERIADRMKEMFNRIYIDKTSYR